MKELNQICLVMQQKQILKNTAGIDTSDFPEKTDLADL